MDSIKSTILGKRSAEDDDDCCAEQAAKRPNAKQLYILRMEKWNTFAYFDPMDKDTDDFDDFEGCPEDDLTLVYAYPQNRDWNISLWADPTDERLGMNYERVATRLVREFDAETTPLQPPKTDWIERACQDGRPHALRQIEQKHGPDVYFYATSDEDAVQQILDNVRSSPWGDEMELTGLRDFFAKHGASESSVAVGSIKSN